MQSLEIAVFEAADPNGFAAKQGDLHRALASLFDGYVGSLGLRSATDPSVFADVVLWESETAAQTAAAALGAMDELAWFASEIAGIRFFDHLVPARDAQAALASIGSAPVVEIVLMKPAVADRFTAAHQALHAELAATDVVVDELRLEMNGNGVAGDLNGWTAGDAMQQLGSTMMARSELQPLFDPENEMMLFMPFTTNVVS